MTNTPNFNLSIAEGTDTVNLLTQCYPNFETIDTVMKENKDAAITTATETKTGTNHSIVRANADAEVFRFTATSDYVAGDTFTVDAQAVTVTTPDGQSLQSGAFVINKSVICCLVGTVLTVFVGGGSSDAQTLGGQLPSYYAKQSDMDVVENDIDTLNSNLTNLETLDFSNTSIEPTTSFNGVVQMLMDKLFPKEFIILPTSSISNFTKYVDTNGNNSCNVALNNITCNVSNYSYASNGAIFNNALNYDNAHVEVSVSGSNVKPVLLVLSTKTLTNYGDVRDIMETIGLSNGANDIDISRYNGSNCFYAIGIRQNGTSANGSAVFTNVNFK